MSVPSTVATVVAMNATMRLDVIGPVMSGRVQTSR
jgi:hypothetical protein